MSLTKKKLWAWKSGGILKLITRQPKDICIFSYSTFLSEKCAPTFHYSTPEALYSVFSACSCRFHSSTFLPPDVRRYRSAPAASGRRWRRRWACAPGRSAGHLWRGSSCPRCKHPQTLAAAPWWDTTGLRGINSAVSERTHQVQNMIRSARRRF